MKQANKVLLLVAAMAATLTVCCAMAKEAPALTRAQWLKKIGTSVTQESVLRETLAQILPDERVEFTQRVLKAVKGLPVSPDEKAAAYVRNAVACIEGAEGELRYKVIAEVFADVPVEYLPMVTNELAKRFSREYHNLSSNDYERVASAVIQAAVERNAKTDEPSVRNTFVVAAFLRSTQDPKLTETLVNLVPTEQARGVVNSLLGTVVKDGNYSALLAAANVEPVTTVATPAVLQTGGGTTGTGTGTTGTGTGTTGTGTGTTTGTGGGGEAAGGGGTAAGAGGGTTDTSASAGSFGATSGGSGGNEVIVDIGVNRIPRGYQNQSTSVL